MARYGVLKPAEARQEKDPGSLVAWLAERAAPSDTAAAITIAELHADYEVWCAATQLTPLGRAAFAAQFDRVRELPEVSGKIRKFGERYYGIALVERTRALNSRVG